MPGATIGPSCSRAARLAQGAARDARGPAGRPAGLARDRGRGDRLHRPRAARRDRPQPRRARDRSGDDRAAAAAGGLVQSARTRGGLGLVPSRIAGAGPIWRERISRAELDRRIEDVHQPYHAALEAALTLARERFGAAILLDCHSMPPRQRIDGAGHATVIFGDRHGTTIDADLLDAAMGAARDARLPDAPATSPMPAATSSPATAARARASTPSRSRSTARSISTRTCAPPAPASKAPAA